MAHAVSRPAVAVRRLAERIKLLYILPYYNMACGIHAHEWPAASDGRHDAHSDGPRKPLAAVLMLVTLLVCCVKASLLLMPWCTVAPPSSDSIF